MNTQKLQNVDRLMQMLAPGTGDSGSLNTYLLRILEAAQTFFVPDLCSIAALNPVTDEFILPLVFQGDVHDAGRFSNSSPRPDGVTRHVLAEGMLFVERLDAQPQYQNAFTAAEGVQSFAAAPLIAPEQHKPLAVLYLDYRYPRAFGEDERAFLQLLVDQASILLQQTWLLYRYAEVTRIGQEINLELETVAVLFDKLRRLVANILDSSHFFMLAAYQAQSDRLDLYMVEDGRLTTWLADPINGVCRWVIREQRPLLIKHRSAETLDSSIRLMPIADTIASEESLIFVPLTIRDVPLGVLSVQSDRPHAYDEDDLQILRLLANHVALAVSNIRLFDNLRQLNQAGQELTQRLDSEQVLQSVVNFIRVTTQADLVTLYPYNALDRSFEVPPRVSGAFLTPDHPQTISSEHDHIAVLTVQQSAPVFAKDSTALYTLLGGDPVIRRGFFAQREKVRSAAATPLRVGGEPVGALFVNFRQVQRFDAPQKQLIESLANYAAIAIANARTFDALVRRRVRELETLQQIDRALARTLDLPATLQTILELATAFIPATRASVYLCNERREALESHAVISEAPIYRRALTLFLRDRRGLVWWAFDRRVPIRVANVKTDPEWREVYVPIAGDILAELDVPLIDGEDVVGVLNFESTHEAAFSADDEKFLVILAGQAVLAIKNAQAYEREKRLAEERQALIAISNEIIRQLDPTRVFALILERALEVTSSSAGTLMLYDPHADHLWMAAEQGVRPEQKNQSHSLDEGIVGLAGRSKQLVNVGDTMQPPWNAIHLSFIPDVRSELAVPLLEDGALRGVLNLESTVPYRFVERDERLLSALADLAVIALQNAERYRKAEERQVRLQALYLVDKQIISQLDDPDQVIQAVLGYALELTQAEAGDLHLYEGATATRTYFARMISAGPAFDLVTVHDAAAASIQRGIVAHVARTLQPYRAQGDAQADQYYVGDPAAPVHSEVAVPLVSGPQLVGVLNLESPRFFAFDDDDVEILQLLAGQAVIAIQNARTYLRLRLLDQAGRMLAEVADLTQLEQAYAVVRDIVRQLQPQSQFSIRRYDADNQELRLVYWDRTHLIQPDPVVRVGDGLNGHVARTRQTLLVPDASDRLYGLLLDQLSSHAQSWMGTPIQFGESYYGNMALTLVQTNSVLATDRLLFEGLAQQLAITIHRLETAQRNRAFQLMSSIGQSASELTHRLGDELGPIPTIIRQIKRELTKLEIDNAAITGKLGKVLQDVQKVLNWNKELKGELGTLKEDQARERKLTDIVVPMLLEQLVDTYPSLPVHTRVTIEVEPDIASIRAVEREIVDVLRNLYKNAIEAMPHGGAITLRARNVGSYVEIQVIDTGNGISARALPNIFDLFYSTKNSSGFGLWSARQYAHANGGELTVVSQVGQGTTFTLKLPCASDMAECS